MCVWVYVGAPCVCCGHGSQEWALDLLELELQVVVSYCVGAESNLGPVQEQRVLITAGPALQPHNINALFSF